VKIILLVILIILTPFHRTFASDASEFFNINLAWSVLNFFLLFLLLLYANKKVFKIGEYLQNRRALFEKEREESNRVLNESESRFREFSARIENIDKEIEEMRTAAINSVEIHKKETGNLARTLADKIRQEAKIIAERELLRARLELKREIVELAVEKATDIIKKEFSKDDQHRLENEFLKDIGNRRMR